jgi:uncharacterized phage-associated protein
MFNRMFKAQKAVEAAGVLLRAEHGSMSYLRLLKLLYIADRESLKESGRPIVGGAVVAMDRGPLHSAVYDLVKGERWDEQVWSQFVEKHDYQVRLKTHPGVGSLCRYEIGKLNEVAQRYAHQDDWELVELTHEFDEWKQHYRDGTSSRIPWEDILAAIGRGEDAEALAGEAAVEDAFRRLFAEAAA